MTIQDEVRGALQPMIDEGVVHMVQASGEIPNPGEHESFTVMVNADNPEVHRVDIMKLLLQAGLKVELRLQPNPSRPQG